MKRFGSAHELASTNLLLAEDGKNRDGLASG